MKYVLGIALLIFASSSAAQSKHPTTLEEWEKCMKTASTGPTAQKIEEQQGIIGLQEYGLSRCGSRPAAKRADEKAALTKTDCNRAYEVARTASECEEFGGTEVDNNFLKSLDGNAFNEESFWRACKKVQAGDMSRAAFGKQICGE